MTNRFYGFNSLEDYSKGIFSLREDLRELTTQDVPENEVLEYAILLLKTHHPGYKGFWAFDDPNTMPADCRVAYVYTPTYLATAILMYSWMNYQKVREFQPLEGLLKDAMLASTGRGFLGHGYEADEGLVDAMNIFQEARAEKFISRYPQFCPEFTECYKQTLLQIQSNQESPLYLAYGSNLNVSQMQYRCPDASIVGTAKLPGWRLMFKGSKTGNYLTIEPNADSAVPVAAWSISEQDERNLDRYEGYPSFYYKKTFFVVVHKADSTVSYPVKAFAYIMHEDRRLGMPTDEYMARCKEGYKAFGFNPTILDEAYRFSCR